MQALSRYVPAMVLVALAGRATAQSPADYEAFRGAALSRYDEYRRDFLQRYFAYRSELIGRWGVGEVTDERSIVHYNGSGTQRIVADFENNQIRVSILTESESGPPPDLEALAARTAALTVSEASKDAHLHIAGAADGRVLIDTMSPGAASELPALIRNAEKTVAPPDLSAQAEQAAREKAAAELGSGEDSRTIAQAENSVSAGFRVARRRHAENSRIHTLVIRFPAEATLARSRVYKPMYDKWTAQYAVDAALALAVSEAESGFNPAARSLIPAFGLMQIVPKTAGLDVNRRLHRKSQPPSSTELYDPETNIDFGVGYLHLLTHEYLKGIDDPTSRMYCAIAAYNTGAGNLARTFSKSHSANVNDAIAVINGLSPEQVYQRLEGELPQAETRKYLERVSARVERWAAAAARW